MTNTGTRYDVSRRAFIGGTAAFAGLPLLGAQPQKKGKEKPKGKDKPKAKEPEVVLPPNAPWETPSGDATPPVMVRRLYLDLAGRIPTVEEATAFVNSKDPQRLLGLVERLLASDAFADYWGMRFCDILRVKSEFPINLWPNAVYVYHRRIREFVKKDEPWDAFTRALLSATGSDFRDAEANFFRATARRTPEGLAEAAALTFLGEEYAELPASTQKEYAKYFSRVRVKNTREWKEEIVYLDPSDPTGPTPVGFADWLLGPARDRFAAAFVQRVDWWLLGLRNPNPAHIDVFKKNGFRLKPLVRAIALSGAYGRGSITGGFPCRRVDAEVLDDMLCDLTGAKRDYQSIAPEPFTFLPGERRSILIEDGSITSSFLLLFGRPARDTGHLSERHNEVTAKQRLFLYNSGQIFQRLSRITDNKAFRNRAMRDIVQDLYWRFLSRPASAPEEKMLLAHFNGLPKGNEKWRFPKDVAWSLLNTREFLYQH
ncbi:MAG: DUF1549 domain-containing protein [Kiritimatiellae bacterium]|nr:DUF1549 domain-containing protein [Kiritimatiellia bacterium]